MCLLDGRNRLFSYKLMQCAMHLLHRAAVPTQA